jgi:hypothetical protein
MGCHGCKPFDGREDDPFVVEARVRKTCGCLVEELNLPVFDKETEEEEEEEEEEKEGGSGGVNWKVCGYESSDNARTDNETPSIPF